MEKLTESELQQMLSLIKRFASTELDQFEHWKFDTEIGKVYLELSLRPTGPAEAYMEVGNLP
jgi:hypothetical protein